MNIQELRIGNYVLKNNAFICAVKELHKTEAKIRFADDNHDIVINYEYIKPIPLTEDILLKCAKFYEEDSMGSKWFGLNIGGEHYGVIELLPDGRVLYDGGFIQYLHEFQNAFYWGKNRKIELNVEL